eukprot:12508862-Ditylum_brightwellii.AAC.1
MVIFPICTYEFPNLSPVAPAVSAFVRVLSPLQKYQGSNVTVDRSSCGTRGACYMRVNCVQ